MSLTARRERDEVLIALRSQGYTYEAIAYHFYMHGFTEWELSRARIEYMLKRAAPHLCGNIRQILNLPRVINRTELFNRDRIRDEANRRKLSPATGNQGNAVIQIDNYRNRGT